MTAISAVDRALGVGLGHDPVTDITGRIERARARLKRERAGERAAERVASSYPVFDAGRFVGIVDSTGDRPAFGPAAPTVLLRRER